MKPIQVFFNNIAYRMNHENDLSDFTWAMCVSCKSFQELFIHFFFEKLDIQTIESIQREIPDEKEGDSRVDLLIRVKNDLSPYLIEVKIGDQNHHFGQYEKAYGVGKERLGYITNYPLTMKDYTIHQWEELYDYIKQIKVSLPQEDQELIDGYLFFLSNVCQFFNFTKPMNIKSLYSMFELFTIIEKLLNETTSEYSVRIYSRSPRSGSELGIEMRTFEIEYLKKWPGKILYGQIGLWYNNENPCISIGFCKEENWAKPIFDIISSSEKKEGTFYKAPYMEDGQYFFDLLKTKMEELDNSQIEKQKEILKEYINEVLMYPLKVLERKQ